MTLPSTVSSIVAETSKSSSLYRSLNATIWEFRYSVAKSSASLMLSSPDDKRFATVKFVPSAADCMRSLSEIALVMSSAIPPATNKTGDKIANVIAKLPLDLCAAGSEVDLEVPVIRKPVNVLARVRKLPFFNPARKTAMMGGV